MPILGLLASAMSGNLFAPSGAYDSIATTTLSTATASVTFSSIPATYTHLQIRMNLLNVSSNTWVFIDFGGTNPVYSHILYGDGGTIYGAAYSNSYSRIIGYASGSTTQPGVIITDILDYANTNKTKTVRSLFGFDMNGATGHTGLISNLYNSTNAVSSLTISCGTNFAQYSSFALYGIKGA